MKTGLSTETSNPRLFSSNTNSSGSLIEFYILD
jgi:hypothetical protein